MQQILLPIVFAVIGIGSLVCWVMEIVAAFKKEEKPLLGILSIVLCSLGGFIIGWIHAGKWGIKNIMLAWTGLVIVGLLLNVLFGDQLAASMANELPAPE